MTRGLLLLSVRSFAMGLAGGSALAMLLSHLLESSNKKRLRSSDDGDDTFSFASPGPRECYGYDPALFLEVLLCSIRGEEETQRGKSLARRYLLRKGDAASLSPLDLDDFQALRDVGCVITDPAEASSVVRAWLRGWSDSKAAMGRPASLCALFQRYFVEKCGTRRRC